ncbi:unnamed protein product, partial [Rotaria magnacalcarata]
MSEKIRRSTLQISQGGLFISTLPSILGRFQNSKDAISGEFDRVLFNIFDLLFVL